MRVGIVSYWFNRGQATVGRYLRSIFADLGYATFVLARPTKDSFVRPRFIDRTDVWDQSGVTAASDYDIPFDEYAAWVRTTGIDVAFFDQNYQFDEIARLRGLGVRTIGRFVWESFKPEHVAGAKRAFEVVYCLTRCEQARYAQLGLAGPWIPWGCHPELRAVRAQRVGECVCFFYPGGYVSKRKPTEAVIEAFSRVPSPRIRLILKAQHPQRVSTDIEALADDDPRIRIVAEDMPTHEYYQLFASCHVCLAPSRWEGLGLHLYEATAFGMPIITNDNPPMNEIVRDGDNGLLVRSHKIGQAASGISSYDPDVDHLARAIEALSDPQRVDELARHAAKARQALSWEKTVKAFRELIEGVHTLGAVGAR